MREQMKKAFGTTAGFIYLDGASDGRGKRIACAVSPFEVSQFAGSVRKELISQGVKKSGTDVMLGLPADIWELSKNGSEIKCFVSTETEYPWILKQTISQDGRRVATQEVTRFSEKKKIPLAHFVLPKHIKWPGEVEVIKSASLARTDNL